MTKGEQPVSPLRAAMANMGITLDGKAGLRIDGRAMQPLPGANPVPSAPPAQALSGAPVQQGAATAPIRSNGLRPRPAMTGGNRHPHPAARHGGLDGPPDASIPPLSAYDEDLIPMGDHPDMIAVESALDAHPLHGHPPMEDAPIVHADPSTGRDSDHQGAMENGHGAESETDGVMVQRFDRNDPRFAWRGFAPGDYRFDGERPLQGASPGYAFARWAKDASVPVATWRILMRRLDRHPPSVQKAMLQQLDIWTARIGSDRVALDELMAFLERDMALPREKVMAAMMLVDAMANIPEPMAPSTVFDNGAWHGL